MTNKSAWLQIEDAEKDLVFSFCEDYKKFLSVAKTERLACTEIIRQAKEKGFRDLEELYKSGEKFLYKQVFLFLQLIKTFCSLRRN